MKKTPIPMTADEFARLMAEKAYVMRDDTKANDWARVSDILTNLGEIGYSASHVPIKRLTDIHGENRRVLSEAMEELGVNKLHR